MSSKQQKREAKRQKIIEEAVSAAYGIVLDGSDGSEEETNYLTAMLAKNFVDKAFIVFQSKMLRKDLSEDP